MSLQKLLALADRAPEGEFWCKGTHAIQVRNWVESRRGPEAFVALLRQHGANAYNRDLLVGGWYDAGQLLSVIEAAAAAEGVSTESAVEEIARNNAQSDLTTVYRVFLKILSPQPVLAFLPRIWRQYFRFGMVEILDNQPGRISFVTHGIHTRFLPWVRGGWRGFLPETIRVSGGRKPKIIKLYNQGAGEQLWDVRVEAQYDPP